ncbi:MAG: cadherin-like beta sandwich domain-containing protein [Bacteroidota bacterium]
MNKFTFTLLIAALSLFSFRATAQDVIDLTGIDNSMILYDTLPDLASGSVVLLEPGMTYLAYGYKFGASVTIQSSDPLNLNRPKIDLSTNFDLADGATFDSLIFRNLEFFYTAYTDKYVINSTVGATIGKIMFDGCYIHDLRGVVRMKGGTGTVDYYVIKNCNVNMIKDYGILSVDVDNTWFCNNIILQNSTFSRVEAFMTSRTTTDSLLIDGCTLSEATAASKRMFRWRGATGMDNITKGITIRNSFFGVGWDQAATGATAIDGFDGLGSTTWTFENSYIARDMRFSADSIQGFNYVYEGTTAALFQDMAASNLNFADTTFVGIGHAGDQRWAMGTIDAGREWNFGRNAFRYLGTTDTTNVVAGLTIHASSAATVVVDANNKTVGDLSFTHRMKMGGTGAFDTDGLPLTRVLAIDVDHSSKITVAAMSSSSSADRTLNIAAGKMDNLIGEFPALGASLTMADYDYYGGPTTLMLFSPSSGVNLYYIKVVDIANTDAKLKALTVDAGALDPAFDPAVTSYAVSFPAGTSTINVTATTNDPNATVTGDGAIDVSSGSATATITVTAEDGTTTETYTIEFSVMLNNDATLSDLTISIGTLTPAFATETLAYTADLPQGTTSVTVAATANDENATVTGTGDIDVTSGSGQASVLVTAEDGTTTQTYTVDFTVLVGVNNLPGSSMLVYPTISNGVFTAEFSGNPGTIAVYDLTGKMILNRKASSSREMIEINRAGIFMVRLSSDNETYTAKVVSVK